MTHINAIVGNIDTQNIKGLDEDSGELILNQTKNIYRKVGRKYISLNSIDIIYLNGKYSSFDQYFINNDNKKYQNMELSMVKKSISGFLDEDPIIYTIGLDDKLKNYFNISHSIDIILPRYQIYMNRFKKNNPELLSGFEAREKRLRRLAKDVL